ncbi:hypothetical protein JQ615_36405 [Bradyrhizobium jicamae]|uniref:Uncharacterized protein n=1 Tax=Bradyrhizobium jicamae TaxID=280332 RepID=A0ABS5FVU3_9BRAD|nr:hypothetical protein [Bradyrhizobium jicamae]MBR0800858.1 hypothetical protein [Bradyrhizobium jicamae]
MSVLQDGEMERVSQLLASGSLSNAREISRLLRAELDEPRQPRGGVALQGYFDLFRRLSRFEQ